MYEFWCVYVKSKYREKAELCCMDTDRIIVYIKIEGIYVDIAKDVEIRCDPSNYELERPLPRGRNKKVILLLKDELGRKIMTKFAILRLKICTYLTDDDIENKQKKAQKGIIKRKPKFEDYKNCLEANHLEKEINDREKNKINTNGVRENHKESIRNNKLRFKLQQRFPNIIIY